MESTGLLLQQICFNDFTGYINVFDVCLFFPAEFLLGKSIPYWPPWGTTASGWSFPLTRNVNTRWSLHLAWMHSLCGHLSVTHFWFSSRVIFAHSAVVHTLPLFLPPCFFRPGVESPSKWLRGGSELVPEDWRWKESRVGQIPGTHQEVCDWV